MIYFKLLLIRYLYKKCENKCYSFIVTNRVYNLLKNI